ncbi:MAG TPA: hypothetical protein DCZ74_01950 [Treponema sp.]|nr:hypothetical protein [Treponema sp.]
MNFWERVDYERDYKNIDRKKLAHDAGFDVSNISKGIKNGNIPSADTAVHIAEILGVSTEYLVMGKKFTLENKQGNEKNNPEDFETLFIRYRKMIHELESLDKISRDAVIALVEKLAEAVHKKN